MPSCFHICSFTTFSERHLPHDIVHILNRYFLRWVQYNHQGRIDKYMGDGIATIFGLEGEEHPAILAYNVAVEMLQRLEGFNEYLQRVYNETFTRQVHYGSVVVGNLDYPEHNSTAIGDTVTVAARIESATGRQHLVSEPVYKAIQETGWESTELLFKGKTESLTLYASLV